MEHYGVKPKWLTQWRVKDLSAFQLSDPSQWGAVAGATRMTTAPRPPRITKSSNPATTRGGVLPDGSTSEESIPRPLQARGDIRAVDHHEVNEIKEVDSRGKLSLVPVLEAGDAAASADA